MNSFKKQREEKLLELLDPQLSEDEIVRGLSDYLESEIAAAFGRGVRQGKSGSASGTGHRAKPRFSKRVK